MIMMGTDHSGATAFQVSRYVSAVCYQAASQGNRELLKMVDLVGIERTTSCMPWNHQGSRPLILKQLVAG